MRDRATISVGIVGAGIAGLTAARALIRAGFAVTVFERTPRLRSVGGALILWSNALTMFERLGLRERLLALASAQVVELGEFRSPQGTLLTSVPIDEMARRHQAETVVVSRADLIGLLAEAVDDIQFDRELRGFTETDGAVLARFSDDSQQSFALLVGADGLHSTVREAVGASQPIRHSQQDLWVGTADWAPRQLSSGVVIATVGAGRRFWCTLLGDGRAFWYATLRSRDRVNDLCGLAELYLDWHAPIPELIARTQAADATRTTMKDREPSRMWGAGRVTLVGDSAHAMTPDLGQGACQAIESALALAECLSTEPDVAAALRIYERRRYVRTADVNRVSWLVAHSSTVSSPGSRLLRDAAIRFGLRAVFMTQLDWLFTPS